MNSMAGPGREHSRPTLGRAARASWRHWPSSQQSLSSRSPNRVAVVTGPVFIDGQAQPVFSTVPATWVRQELWVETTIDSDFDGQPDRIHIDVTWCRSTPSASRSPSSWR